MTGIGIRRSLAACLGFLFTTSFAGAAGWLAPTDAGLPPLEVREHKAEATITDQVARTRVTQVFFNPSDRPLEGHYLFPVPRGAHVSDFVLYMEGEAVRAEVMEKEKAAQIYEDIVRRMRDPGLLEFLDRELYRVRVFPIPARGDVKIEIEFNQILDADAGVVTYSYPTSVPAYGRSRGAELDFQFAIASKAPIRTVYSPTHAIRFDKRAEHETTGRLDGKGGAGADATLIYTLSQEDIGLSALTFRPDSDEDGYFLILISPKFDFEEKDIQPKAVTFVIDTSGSMAKDGKMEQAKAALRYCLDSLKPKDHFNIIRFQTTVEAFAEDLVPAEGEALEEARKFVDRIKARGGTNIDEALRRAMANEPPDGAVHTIAFLTDGQPTVGVTQPDAILEGLREANHAGLRVFSFGVGYDVNAALLDRIADETGALSQYIRPEEDIEVAVSSFFDKVAHPVLTNVELAIRGVRTSNVFPIRMPDLFVGSQLSVLGRYEGAGEAEIALSGNLADQKETFKFKTPFPKEDDGRDYIEPLWGQRKVGYLLDEIRRHGENEELRDEVVELAKRYGIATPYTSFLATEDTLMAQQARAARLGDRRDESALAPPLPAPETGAVVGGISGQAGRDRSASSPRGGYGYGALPRGTPAAPSAASSVESNFFRHLDAGRAGVELSEDIALRRRAEVVSRETAIEEKRASGRRFTLAEGVWTDETIEKRETTLEVKFLSDAYFEILTLRPDLKEALSLGENIEVRLDDKTVLRIGDEGKETLDEADKKTLERTKPKK